MKKASFLQRVVFVAVVLAIVGPRPGRAEPPLKSPFLAGSEDGYSSEHQHDWFWLNHAKHIRSDDPVAALRVVYFRDLLRNQFDTAARHNRDTVKSRDEGRLKKFKNDPILPKEMDTYDSGGESHWRYIKSSMDVFDRHAKQYYRNSPSSPIESGAFIEYLASGPGAFAHIGKDAWNSILYENKSGPLANQVRHAIQSDAEFALKDIYEMGEKEKIDWIHFGKDGAFLLRENIVHHIDQVFQTSSFPFHETAASSAVVRQKIADDEVNKIVERQKAAEKPSDPQSRDIGSRLDEVNQDLRTAKDPQKVLNLLGLRAALLYKLELRELQRQAELTGQPVKKEDVEALALRMQKTANHQAAGHLAGLKADSEDKAKRDTAKEIENEKDRREVVQTFTEGFDSLSGLGRATGSREVEAVGRFGYEVMNFVGKMHRVGDLLAGGKTLTGVVSAVGAYATLVGGVFDLVSLLFGGDTRLQQEILDNVIALRKELATHNQQMHYQFSQVHEGLAEQYRRTMSALMMIDGHIIENAKSLEVLKGQMRDVQNSLALSSVHAKEYAQAIEASILGTKFENCAADAKPSDPTYKECLIQFRTCAVYNSGSLLNAGKESLPADQAEFYRYLSDRLKGGTRFSLTSPDTVGYLSAAAKQIQSADEPGPFSSGRALLNVELWTYCAANYLRLALQFPDKFEKIASDEDKNVLTLLREIRDAGRRHLVSSQAIGPKLQEKTLQSYLAGTMKLVGAHQKAAADAKFGGLSTDIDVGAITPVEPDMSKEKAPAGQAVLDFRPVHHDPMLKAQTLADKALETSRANQELVRAGKSLLDRFGTNKNLPDDDLSATIMPCGPAGEGQLLPHNVTGDPYPLAIPSDLVETLKNRYPAFVIAQQQGLGKIVICYEDVRWTNPEWENSKQAHARYQFQKGNLYTILRADFHLASSEKGEVVPIFRRARMHAEKDYFGDKSHNRGVHEKTPQYWVEAYQNTHTVGDATLTDSQVKYIEQDYKAHIKHTNAYRTEYRGMQIMVPEEHGSRLERALKDRWPAMSKDFFSHSVEVEAPELAVTKVPDYLDRYRSNGVIFEALIMLTKGNNPSKKAQREDDLGTVIGTFFGPDQLLNGQTSGLVTGEAVHALREKQRDVVLKQIIDKLKGQRTSLAARLSPGSNDGDLALKTLGERMRSERALFNAFVAHAQPQSSMNNPELLRAVHGSAPMPDLFSRPEMTDAERANERKKYFEDTQRARAFQLLGTEALAESLARGLEGKKKSLVFGWYPPERVMADREQIEKEGAADERAKQKRLALLDSEIEASRLEAEGLKLALDYIQDQLTPETLAKIDFLDFLNNHPDLKEYPQLKVTEADFEGLKALAALAKGTPGDPLYIGPKQEILIRALAVHKATLAKIRSNEDPPALAGLLSDIDNFLADPKWSQPRGPRATPSAKRGETMPAPTHGSRPPARRP